jgi:serine O-acetyltransferase
LAQSPYNSPEPDKQSCRSANQQLSVVRLRAAAISRPYKSVTAMFTRLREDIATIRERDPAARSAWEVLTCYPGLHALILHRVAHAFWRAKRRWLARFVSQLARFLTGIEIHPGATVGRRVFIDHGMGVVVGETAEIGDDCTIYQGVTLGGTSLTRGAKRHPTLERGVIVGAGAKVLGGFTIGAEAKIGSNAVVVKPVPAGGTAVGNPARVIVPAAVPAAASDARGAKPAPARTGHKRRTRMIRCRSRSMASSITLRRSRNASMRSSPRWSGSAPVWKRCKARTRRCSICGVYPRRLRGKWIT